MCASLAGRTCLFFFLGFLAGCGNSDTKPLAANQPTAHAGSATASSDQTIEKSAASGSAKKSVEASPDDKLGFKHTWHPGSTPQAKSSAVVPVAAHRDAEEERYAEVTPAPAVGGEVIVGPALAGPAKTTAPSAPAASGGAKTAEVAPIIAPIVPAPYKPQEPASILPARSEAARVDPSAIDTPPAGNPLRDPGGDTVTGRLEAPPQPALAPEPVGAAPETSPTPAREPRPVEKSESVIQIKPEATSAAPLPLPATARCSRRGEKIGTH